MRSWRYYKAKAERIREHNVFLGPLDTDAGDIFIHYLRQGTLGNGTDFFGIYCEDHAAWLAVQPKNVGLVEVAEKGVPTPNQFTELRAVKTLAGRAVEDVGLALTTTTKEPIA